MTQIKRIILDLLKPHKPNALDFAKALAELSDEIKVKLTVVEVDEKTESVVVTIEDESIDFDAISKRIDELGASIHSIDEVEVIGNKIKQSEIP